MIPRNLIAIVAIACLPVAANAGGTACKAIPDPQKRLACYDDLERRGELDVAPGTGQHDAAGDPANFGVPITRSSQDALNDVGPGPEQSVALDDDGLVESITSQVVEYSVSADRMVTVVLANGQVWRQVSGRELWLKSGTDANIAKISRTILGGFSMTINGKNDVAIVKRLDGKRSR
jgi:hypothetical protein